MPLFDYHCKECGYDEEVLIGTQSRMVSCDECGARMTQKFPGNQMIKMKGEGGYPSRKKQVFNTTLRNHPNLT